MSTANPSYRVSVKGEGEILDRAGNPLNGVQKEVLVRRANAYDDLRDALNDAFMQFEHNGEESDSDKALLDKIQTILRENP